jgi:hypothetical protein
VCYLASTNVDHFNVDHLKAQLLHKAFREARLSQVQGGAECSPMARGCTPPRSSRKVEDIDSTRMVIRVEQGEGRKDRYVML